MLNNLFDHSSFKNLQLHAELMEHVNNGGIFSGAPTNNMICSPLKGKCQTQNLMLVINRLNDYIGHITYTSCNPFYGQ